MASNAAPAIRATNRDSGEFSPTPTNRCVIAPGAIKSAMPAASSMSALTIRSDVVPKRIVHVFESKVPSLRSIDAD